MPRQNLERAVGSVIIGVIVGALVSGFTAGILITSGLASGRIRLIAYPAMGPRHWDSWVIWTIAVSVAVGLTTTIHVSRSVYRTD